jgi:hypothetical protein
MKKIFTIFVSILFAGVALAQSPGKMSYQAVIRDAGSHLVVNHAVGMKFTILQGSASGSPVYSEVLTTNTNENGLVTIEIGGGPGFYSIDWAMGPYFLKTETDPTGGSSYSISGTSQLLSVPYALHAKTAESAAYASSEFDPVFASSLANSITQANLNNWNLAFVWGNHATASFTGIPHFLYRNRPNFRCITG